MQQILLVHQGTQRREWQWTKKTIDKVQFAVNLEFLEAEYFSWAAYGYGLDVVAPNLPMGGPPPIGARKANLDPLTMNIIMEFANQEIGHLRFIQIMFFFSS